MTFTELFKPVYLTVDYYESKQAYDELVEEYGEDSCEVDEARKTLIFRFDDEDFSEEFFDSFSDNVDLPEQDFYDLYFEDYDNDIDREYKQEDIVEIIEKYRIYILKAALFTYFGDDYKDLFEVNYLFETWEDGSIDVDCEPITSFDED